MAFTKETAKSAGQKGGQQPKKRDVITQHLIAELNHIDETTKISRARMIARSLVIAATEGKLDAQKELIDRVEGKARQEVDVNSNVELTVVSAAVSVLAELVGEAAGRAERPVTPNPLPN